MLNKFAPSQDGNDGKVVVTEDEATTKISVSLSATDRLLLERIFEDKDTGEVANSLAQIAFEEWLGWISGRQRFISLTDQSIERVITIYTQVMPNDEPEVGFLYNRFSIPYGRARYIVQAIIDRQLYGLNARALERLIETLEDQEEYLDQLDEQERKVLQEIRIVVDPRAEKMLSTIIEQMPLEVRPFSTFKRIPTSLPNTREYTLAPRDLKPVLDAVRKFRA